MTSKKALALCFIFLVVGSLNVVLSCSKPTKPKPPLIEPCDLFQGWASWSNDGRYFAFDYVMDSINYALRFGSNSIWVYDSQTNKFGFFVGPGMFPRWSPDGSIVAFEWGNEIYFYYLATATVRQATNLGQNIYTFRWLPGGGRLCAGEDIMVVDTTGLITKTIKPFNGIDTGWASGADANWSATSESVLVAGSFTRGIWGAILTDSLGNLLRSVITPATEAERLNDIAWSPLRDKFAASYANDAGDSADIQDARIFNMDGSVYRILAPDAGMPDWSPDGSKIIFQKYTFMGDNPDPMGIDYSRVTIWICNADGSDMHELLGWPQQGYDSTMFSGGYNWATDTHDP